MRQGQEVPTTPSTTSPAPPEPDDFIGALEKNGVMGIIDSMRLFEKYQTKSLQEKADEQAASSRRTSS